MLAIAITPRGGSSDRTGDKRGCIRNLGRLGSPEARIVLGAPVIDDMLGLIVLAVVSGLIQSGLEPIGYCFVPVFFVLAGMKVDLAVLKSLTTILLALGVTLVAIEGKLLTGSLPAVATTPGSLAGAWCRAARLASSSRWSDYNSERSMTRCSWSSSSW